MTFRDSSDQEVAEEVLKRLRAKGLTSLRQMEAAGPVSRTTIGGWTAGRYAMKGPTRASCLEWLGVIEPKGRELTEVDEKLIAAKWMERKAAELRAEATSEGAGAVRTIQRGKRSEGSEGRSDGAGGAR